MPTITENISTSTEEVAVGIDQISTTTEEVIPEIVMPTPEINVSATSSTE